MTGNSEPIIIDEWLWSDLSGENGEQKLKETFLFLDCLYKKCDKVATIRGSKYEEKFFNFCKHSDNISRKIIKYYKDCIFYNSQKYIAAAEEECQQFAEDDLSNVKDDDRYLVKLCFKLHCTFITTDKPLLNTLKAQKIQCEHRDSFLEEYIKKYNK
ncbi:MAG: hypothetical protein M1491_05020 [Deltaproteobacteria bacterium]|nr:hypothetical protein [Deltaproteobacteria bacterium]MCL5276721.1 hypothetical protein [Deltaproteobacteria bacterium]